MECPRCGSEMQEETFDAHLGRAILIDICHRCQSFWFDARESVALTPGSTLALFRIIGDRLQRPERSNADVAKCPRCKGRLRRTRDMQRSTRFEYLNCRNGHGRLISFFDFLREKDFIRPLTMRQVADLRHSLGAVNCANCGAVVDVAKGGACAHCGSPLSMLDMTQADRLVTQLKNADAGRRRSIDPSLPIELERVKRHTEWTFDRMQRDDQWVRDVLATDLVGAGLRAVAAWFKKSS